MKRLSVLSVIVFSSLLLAYSTTGNAQISPSQPYNFYQIVDNSGALLSSTTGAGFTPAVCTNVLSGARFVISCAPSIYYYRNFPLEVSLIGGARSCANEPPVPFQEYDLTQFPEAQGCFSGVLNSNLVSSAAPGLPRCQPGQPSTTTNPCEEPYLFTAVPTATTATGTKLVPSLWTITYTDFSNSAIPQGVPTVVPCLEPNGSITCTSYGLENNLYTGQLPFIKLTYAPPIACSGFEAPFNTSITLPKNSKRAIPLIITLTDQNNAVVTPTSLNAAAPTVVVNYSSTSGTSTYIDTAELLPEGQSSTGNQFTFNTANNTWQFNLNTANFTAPGTYTVSVASGDGSQYAVSPACSQTFTR